MLSIALSALLSFSLLIQQVHTSPCLAFDSDFNLLAFGFGGKDFNLGPQSTWNGNGAVTDITTTGRPPFDGANTTCYLAQFFSAIYVINGDASNPDNVGIYDATAKSWTTQQISTSNTGGSSNFDLTSFDAILDHDTNVFYALSHGALYNLDFSALKTTATSSSIPWLAVSNPPFTTDGYDPVMALAQNHIHFLNVPGAQPGTADIFVIHFSFFQPTPQAYPINGSSNNFPETHGQVASFFQPSGQGVQQEFAFIPADASATYVINVESNTTAQLAGPSDKSASTFYASVNALVQLTSDEKLFFLPYTQGDASTNAAAQWTSITLTGLPAAGSSSSSSSASSSATGSSHTSSASSKSGSGSSSSTGSASTPSNTSAGFTLVASSVMSLIGGLLVVAATYTL
ncbi:hypothetical protein SISSUDRAFT_992301 [Sistotremastrum suecicum HHB10207 ss-3]|uniref:Uncharacterized protein n=1 Tax=Sistotremastrum suecicum HHB10207 ss-3 TaxID=1314776 RepID=A0A165Z9M5_9AGAM|nr:hypothetical protein SISSUDRAFT_992301 [Sistotremastrum suecicum HHB10207 ss-3]